MKLKAPKEDYYDWLRNPVTSSMGRLATAEADKAMRQLLHACRVSTDPEVRAKYQAYIDAIELRELLNGKGKYESTDVDE